MKKQAITYYHDAMRGHYSHIDIHESGAAATKHFLANADQFFSTPIIFKNKNMKLVGGQRLSVSIGFRGYYARFLDEQEVVIYATYGSKTHIDFKTGKLIAPPDKENKEVDSNVEEEE